MLTSTITHLHKKVAKIYHAVATLLILKVLIFVVAVVYQFWHFIAACELFVLRASNPGLLYRKRNFRTN